MRATNFDIPEMLATTPLSLPLSRTALILARPSLAVEFVVSIQNLTKIKQGRIALIQVDPMDMLTYDSLRVWRSLLSKTAPTMAAGRSLIILTALPKGTVYNEESITYKEQINLSVASAAALAMQLVQMHLQEGGGNIGSSSNLFLPLSTLAHIHIPTLPSITFHYQTHNGDISQGIFDLFLFSPKPNLTESADIVNKLGRYADIFNLIDIIHYPQLLPQWRGRMDWPGDGMGPRRAYCLVATCEFDLIKAILLINLLGVINAGLIYLCILLINRGIICKKKRPISFKLVFLKNEFVFEDNDGNVAAESSNTSRRNTQSQADMVPNLDALTSFHALISTAQVPLAASSLNEEALPSVKKRSTAWLNGVQVYVKQLGLPRIVLRSKLIEYLAGLREIRHENINAFMGCCVTSDSFSLVFEYCHRGCLQDVINNKSIPFDWDFKLSLMTDFVRGMEYLHSTSLKAHGRLKSTNCVVSGRWVLKITDFGIPNIYNLTGNCPTIKLEDKLWTSPELLRDETAALFGTRQGDVYAFAIIMHEVFYQTKPYGLEDIPAAKILERVLGEEKPPFRPQLLETDVPLAYRNILERAWLENPSLRPTFTELNEEIQRMTKKKKMNVVEHMFKMMESYSSQLEEQVRSRMNELEMEKKKKELLICRMLPPVVAEALKAGAAVAPETYDEASIYISDIVGFTTISAISTPLQVVDFLNDLYTLFDKTIANYDVYKVETIGDAYMVASGLPLRNGRRHAGEVATMALDLLSACGTFTIKHLPEVPLRLRIGLHSGPCVAGVVGLTMPRYCLFGDTVNQALKMESSGAAFRIHISEHIKEILDEIGGYHVEYRGLIEFEGGMEITSYWLINSDNFYRPLPEPPPLISGGTHGLACVYPEAAKIPF
ncbi:retinal guanylyl cyclase 2 [Echinococcus multilocularis]|uniref:Guanylate cyclase n=1 Tax=Echinococcus multilocularis TaxID=6211 RepID=A0A068Y138_ECHMU|nr:retinal guanylyl cyclase 2 [Echinococcus multilocularis]